MMTYLCALMLAMSPAAQKAPGSPGTGSQDLIVIDGHKDPSKIPEWAAWEDGFATIDAWSFERRLQSRAAGGAHP